MPARSDTILSLPAASDPASLIHLQTGLAVCAALQSSCVQLTTAQAALVFAPDCLGSIFAVHFHLAAQARFSAQPAHFSPFVHTCTRCPRRSSTPRLRRVVLPAGFEVQLQALTATGAEGGRFSGPVPLCFIERGAV